MTSHSFRETSGIPFVSFPRWAVQAALLGFTALAFASVCAGSRSPLENTALPFAIGEKLTYEVSLANGSKVGTATMWIDGPVDVRGTSTLLLRFDSRIRYLLIPAVSHSSSWFDPVRGASLRFSKHERNPLSRLDESI